MLEETVRNSLSIHLTVSPPKTSTNRGDSIVRDIARPDVVRGLRAGALLRRALVASLGALPLLIAAPAHAGVLDRVRTFQIQPEVLRQALLEFGRQAHVQIVMRRLPQTDIQVKGLAGRYSGRQAVNRLLSGTGLTYAVSDHTVEVFPREPGAARPTATVIHSVSKSYVQRSRKDQSADHQPKHSPPAPPSLREVIVTGTHISGGPPPSEPIITITQREIRESGYQTMEQLMDALPENFASVGSGQGIGLPAQNTSGNNVNGVALDLNGLGFDSTLVLVNGHRLAPAGSYGAFTDVSIIPLDAVKRIDVMTNGASAIYGADAVGGVVNYILKSHLNGATTSVEYGSVTHGGVKDFRAVQSAGTSWTGGSAFMTYEYHKRTALMASDRTYTKFAGPFGLLPSSYQNSVYATASQRLGSRTNLEADALFTNRQTYSQFAEGSVPVATNSGIREYDAALELSRRLGRHWRGHIRVSDSGNRSVSKESYGNALAHSGLLSESLGATGPVVMLPAGAAKVAMGVQAREATYSTAYTGAFVSQGALSRRRTVWSIYAETSVPLLAEMIDGVHRAALNLDLATRYEHYSDFGATLDPMAGLAYQPTREIRLRATISSSFRAPNFEELYGQQALVLFNAPDPRLGGTLAPVLIRSGSNPQLHPEKSTEWTAGVDFDGGALHMPISLTYFQVRFRDRIGSPQIPIPLSLEDQSVYGPFTLWSPSVGELQSLLSRYPQFYNDTIYPGFGPVASVLNSVAISDDRLQNIGVTNVDGLDLNARYHAIVDTVRYHLNVQASYLTKYQNIFVPGSAPEDLLSTYQNPVNFRARILSGLSKGGWSGNIAINYTNHYINNTGAVNVGIASWTTIDVQLAYHFLSHNRFLRGLEVAMSCTNCSDHAPPFVSSPDYIFEYDPINANPLGRFLSLQLRKSW